jgi:TonB family protein
MTRRKISGELPKYPQGATVSAQVRIRTVVLPDGTVRSVQPEQKANSLFEEAAMKAVRSWKFEPLGSSLPQVEQTCIITFSFKLK